jgi:replication-associated recombination protein RarA
MAAVHLSTIGGYDFYEVGSALQKSIRRGDEEAALYWALELAGPYDTFLWRRLAVIASEDVGPADNTMAVLIDVLAVNYRDLQKASRRPQERIVLAHAIIALCRAPKSRIADDLAALISHQRDSEGLRREIPDEALDQHTRRGKAMGRSWEHWADEGCRLAHEVEGLNVYRERALAMRQRYGRAPPRAKTGRRRKGEQPELFEEDEA